MSKPTFLSLEVQQALADVEKSLWMTDESHIDVDVVQVLVDEIRRMERRYQKGHPIVVQLPEKPAGEGGI